MRTAALCNLGCKVNAYEADAMAFLLTEAGYRLVPFDSCADIYIINTCTVTNMADRKSRQMLHRARRLNPSAVIVAAGCFCQTHEAAAVPADIIVGNNHKNEIVKVLEDYFSAKDRCEAACCEGACTRMEDERAYEMLEISETTEHTRAFIKIQDGCNQFCSYCVIPYARGRVRSRTSEDIEQEVRRLSRHGYKEIVLTGIHLSSYGTDRKVMEDTAAPELSKLVSCLGSIDGIERIRLGSLEPRIITPAFLETLSRVPAFCPHFHLSLQSGCDKTLEAMNRRYTSDEYRSSCEMVRSVWPDAAITTDIITGFPGETEEDFQISYEFVDSIHFFETHVFKYSRRAGTRADEMDGQLSEAVKNERSAAMLLLNERHKKEYMDHFMRRRVEILLEEQIQTDMGVYMTGHTREYIHAAVKADDLPENAEHFSGTIIDARPYDYLNSEIMVCNIDGSILK